MSDVPSGPNKPDTSILIDSKGETMGPSTAVALIMGSIIGTGVFILPSSVAEYGWLGMIGLIMATVGAVALALVFASLSKRRPMQGGPYAYAREGYGDFAGFTNAWSYWCAAWPGNSAIAVAWAGYVMALFGWDDKNVLLKLAICAVGLFVPMAINLIGVKSMGAFQIITTILKITPLVFMGTVGLVFAFRYGNWPEFNPSGQNIFTALATSLSLAAFVYVGVETASIAASKVRNPDRNVPLATVGGTVGTAVVYILVTIAVYGIVPGEELRTTTAPFSLALDQIFGGTWGGKVVALFAVISGIGALNSWAMITAEVPQAAARNKVFPQFFARVNRKNVPYWGVISGQVLSFVLIAVASIGQSGVAVFNTIVLMSNVAVGVPYFFSVLAQLYYLYTEGRRLDPRTFPREVVIAIIALIFSVYMIYGAGETSVFIGFIAFLVGWIVMMGLYIKTGRYGSTSLAERPGDPTVEEALAQFASGSEGSALAGGAVAWGGAVAPGGMVTPGGAVASGGVSSAGDTGPAGGPGSSRGDAVAKEDL
ncbi:amino acid permease [Devriesea agamarum]|uniref:amino acid permease n=1 Tax=Devriesea agamarum TaxID=472569 RepID=UPI00071C5D25|nr:amino acid permease [Devriesea agamarum]